MANRRAAELISALALTPHPEGGFYREIYRSASTVSPADDRAARASLTTIYFLLTDDALSRWHRVRSDEVWHLYEGGPLELLDFDLDGGNVQRHRLAGVGPDSRPVAVIEAGHWQAARSIGPFTLVGCTVAPGFDFADFQMMSDDAASVAIVNMKWPELVKWI
jgi:uncharacterized protein